MTPRTCRKNLVALFLVMGLSFLAADREAKASKSLSTVMSRAKTPVILDSDIGDDIDDTWALGLILKSPELDLKLAVGEFGKANYRAKLLAKFLETASRTDVPVGVGLDVEPKGIGGQSNWVESYSLESYPGKVYKDGVQAMIDMIMKSRVRLTLIAIGPLTNIAEALVREPRIAQRVNFVGMDGSVRLGYGGSKTLSAEWNIKADIKAAQKVFSARWHSMTITPLDTCGIVGLDGDRYRKMLESKDVIASTVIENYRLWSNRSSDAERHSTTLYDTVAVYLATHHELCHMERMRLRVDDSGMTVFDPKGNLVNVATTWVDRDKYLDYLTDRLTSTPQRD